MSTLEYDVGIIGGGLAGNLLARQIRLAMPHLSVGLFEKTSRSSFKVGESMVEIASNYFIRRLGLSSYLYDRQLPKNGLRFFFDTPEKNCELDRMSEIGSVALPYHPSFQIDRARLDRDLQHMNQENGIVFHGESRIHDLRLADGMGRSQHRFKVSTKDRTQEGFCRWVIDASGRSSLIARQLGLRLPETGHPLGAVWGRFENVVDWDRVGPEHFRERIRYSSRMLSTNHFCYPGYWIWFIPLGRGITSVGVVCERGVFDQNQLGKHTRFLTFLRSHRAVGSLLEKARMIDIGGYGQLAYNTRCYFSGQRWGLTGEAAAFADPFYSPGSDFIAVENDFLTNLIARDDEGASPEEVHALAELCNRYMSFRFEATMRLYRGLYSLLGSYELFQVKWQLDFALYYHLWLSQYQQDLHLDRTAVLEQLEEQAFTLNALDNFAAFFRHIEQQLWKTGDYFRGNVGQFADGLEGIDFIRDVGLPQGKHQELKRLNRILNDVHKGGLRVLARSHESGSIKPLSEFVRRGAAL